MKLPPIFRSLTYPNYRLYFIGQSLSLIGTWMQRMAVSWLIYRLTDSAFILGLVVFAGMVPTFILSPYSGVICDRHNKYNILLITQIAAMAQAAILATLVITGHYSIISIIALSSLLGIINAFDTPARQSLLASLVDKKDMANGIALNSSIVNLAMLIGPAVAGLILASYGEGICFLLNAGSFLATITCLLLMKLPKEVRTKPTKNLWEDFTEGFAYLKENREVGMVILLLALISLLVLPYSTLLPVFAKNIFHGDAKVFGLLNAVSGLGALCSALYLAAQQSARKLSNLLLIAVLVFGVALVFFASFNMLAVALCFVAMAGAGRMGCIAAGNAFVQTNVTDNMRGRVISFYAIAFFGMQPIGNLLIGYLAEHLGVQTTLMLQGGTGIVLFFIFLPYLRKKEPVPVL